MSTAGETGAPGSIEDVLGKSLSKAERANVELVNQIAEFNAMWRDFEAAKRQAPSARSATIQRVYRA